MIVMNVIAVGIGGGIGAVCRYAVTRAIGRWCLLLKPVATLLVNLLASLLVGVISGCLALRFSESFRLISLLSITGFCGGFSTFSTAINELLVYFEHRQWLVGLAYVMFHVLLPMCMLVIGCLLASMLL